MKSFTISGPFPSRKAYQVLRDRLIAHLSACGAEAGTPFCSDAQLMEKSGLSRTTVRKAVDELCAAGWVERRTGVGSFVGPRVGLPQAGPALPGKPRERTARRGAVRVAVLLHLHAAGGVDFFTRGVLQGLDSAALEQELSVELIGDYNACIRTLAQRLARARADVLVVMPATARHALQAGAAEGLGIPCLLAGSHLFESGLPLVQEDGEQGVALAVRHLAERGHRIGLWLSQVPAIWVHERRNGYLQALRECGLVPDERLLLWTPYSPVADTGCHTQMESVPLLDAYMREQQPSALILGSSGQHTRALSEWLRRSRTRVPHELSLVCFDQNDEDYSRYLRRSPTVVALPLVEMGRELARLARVTAGDAPRREQPAPAFIKLPCTLVEGDSVAPPRGDVGPVRPTHPSPARGRGRSLPATGAEPREG